MSRLVNYLYLFSAILLLLAAYLAPSVSHPAYYYSVARVYRVVDGDTAWMTSVWGYRQGIRFKVRFAGIDAPEISTPEGIHSARELNSMLYGKCVVLAVPRSDSRDRYGRVVAIVLIRSDDSWTNVNYVLARKGLARPVDYGVPPEELLIPNIPIPGSVAEAYKRGC